MITAIYFNSPGTDTGTNASRNGEWIALKNSTSVTKTLTGWTVRDHQQHVYKFGTFRLGPHKTVKIHTGTGTNTSITRFWGQHAYIWNNTGDTAGLHNAAGKSLDTCTYKASASPEAHC